MVSHQARPVAQDKSMHLASFLGASVDAGLAALALASAAAITDDESAPHHQTGQFGRAQSGTREGAFRGPASGTPNGFDRRLVIGRDEGFGDIWDHVHARAPS